MQSIIEQLIKDQTKDQMEGQAKDQTEEDQTEDQTMIDDNECPICMENIDPVKNRMTTECGHCFHSSCLIKHSVLTNVNCPMCRHDLADIPEDDEDTSDGATSVSSESSYDSESTTDSVPSSQKRNITQILAEMKRRGITERHLITTLISITYQDTWANRYFTLNETDNKEEEVFDVLDNITTLPVDYRDTRRYADVLLNVQAVSEAGVGPTVPK